MSSGTPRWRRVLAAISDRLNPVLVKEVRQALRGNYFRFTFWITVSGATILAVLMLVAQEARLGEADGQQFFTVMFGCLAIAVLGLVPFFAFVAMGGEWEENTYDLLCLSDLKPRQIVLGKILSAGIQAMLYFSAFGPFLVFAFLMQGVDLVLVAVLLSASAVLSLVLSTGAVAASTLSLKRYVRMFLHASLAAGLAFVTIISIQAAIALAQNPHTIRTPEFAVGMGLTALGVVWLGTFGYAAALGRLAHSEENASSAGRALTFLGVPLALAGFSIMMSWMPGMSGNGREAAFVFFTLAFLVLFVNSVLFAAERERLGRRARRTVPRNRVLAFLVTPLLPGGGRGLLLYTVAGLLLVLGLGGLRMTHGESLSDLSGRFTQGMLVVLAYGFVYISLPRLLLGKRATPTSERVLSVALVGAGAFVPTAAGFFFEVAALRSGEHAGNPFWVLDELLSGSSLAGVVATGSDLGLGVLWPLLVLVVIGWVGNAARMGRGITEVLRASAENEERRSAEAAPAPEGHAA